jgi:hypothetical protein
MTNVKRASGGWPPVCLFFLSTSILFQITVPIILLFKLKENSLPCGEVVLNEQVSKSITFKLQGVST